MLDSEKLEFRNAIDIFQSKTVQHIPKHMKKKPPRIFYQGVFQYFKMPQLITAPSLEAQAISKEVCRTDSFCCVIAPPSEMFE